MRLQDGGSRRLVLQEVCPRLPIRIAPHHGVHEIPELLRRDLAILLARVHMVKQILRVLHTLVLRLFLTHVLFREINQLVLSHLAAMILINHVEEHLLNRLVAEIRPLALALVLALVLAVVLGRVVVVFVARFADELLEEKAELVRLQDGGGRRLVLQEGDGTIVTILLLRLLLRRIVLPLLRVRHLLGPLDLLLDLLLGMLVRHPFPASIRPLLQRLNLLLQHLLAVAAALAVSQDGVVTLLQE